MGLAQPVLGWRGVQWTPKQGPKKQCVACNRKDRKGIAHVNDRSIPPERMLCIFCYRVIMAPENAQAPEASPETP